MRIFSINGTSYNLNVPFSKESMSRLQGTVYKAFRQIVHFACPAHFLTNCRDMSRAFCTSRLQALIYKACANAMSRHVPLNVPLTLKRDIAPPYL